VTVTERTEPVDVDTIVTGEWIITLNAEREIYRDGAILVHHSPPNSPQSPNSPRSSRTGVRDVTGESAGY
jgi:hypothetical protein